MSVYVFLQSYLRYNSIHITPPSNKINRGNNMNFKKGTLLVIAATAAIFLSGCVSSESSIAPSGDDFIYRGHDFGPDRDAGYRQGVKDGCRTTDGDYTKNHAAYKTEESYHMGWEHGRLHCKGTSEK
jgi:hypothetical protein